MMSEAFYIDLVNAFLNSTQVVLLALINARVLGNRSAITAGNIQRDLEHEQRTRHDG